MSVANEIFEFEFDDPQEGSCSCCGSTQLIFVRFVYKNHDAYAIYKAWLPLGSHQPVADVLATFGEWGDEATAADRVEFRFNLWSSESDWNVTITDCDADPSQDRRMGKPLSRDEALVHPWIQDVFDLSDEIVRSDTALVEALTEIHSIH